MTFPRLHICWSVFVYIIFADNSQVNSIIVNTFPVYYKSTIFTGQEYKDKIYLSTTTQ